SSFDVRAVHPGHRYLENTIMVAGRYLNQLDLDERRKVAVIGAPVAEFLFDRDQPLGKWLQINNIQYQVIGMFEDTGGEGELRKIYIPITTAQMAYGGHNRIDQIMFTVGGASEAESRIIEKSVHALL